MPTAAELLAMTSNADKTLVIDNDLRTIKIPSSVTNLGVESDDEVLRLNFRMPRYLGKTDLSTFAIRINYLNAMGEGDVYSVSDMAIVGDNLTFSWLVGPNATKYKGNTKFNVCMKIVDSEGYIQKEYNTTIATLPVLEGLETEEGLIEFYSDILEQWKNQLFGIGDTEEANLAAKSEEEQENIAQKGIEVLATIPEDYQSTYEMANNAYRTRANAIVSTEQGEVIGLIDSSADPLRGLRVFGKTTQVKTTGKNLLPQTCATQTVSGVTFTVNADGSITANGTSTGVFSYAINSKLMGLQSGAAYTITGNPYESAKYMLYFDQKDSNGTNLGSCQDYGNGATATLSENYEYMWVGIFSQAGVTFNNVTFYPMIRLASITDDTYEPYSGGIPTPSPDYPQKLVSIENPTVDIYGKNLLNITASTQTLNGVTFTIKDDKTVVINGIATADTYCGLTQPFVLNPGKYVLSGCTNGGSSTYFLYSDVGAIYNRDSAVEFTIDAPSERKFLIKVHSGVTITNAVIKPMLCLADVDDNTYEMPKEVQTAAFTYTLPGIPVSQNGNYTDSDGQQWICDEIDFERGVYVKRINEISLPSTFTINENTNEMWIQLKDSEAAAYDTPAVQCLCTHFPATSRQEVYDHAFEEGYCGIAARDRFVRIVDNATFNADPNALNTWIAEQTVAGVDVILKYILANPIETKLTAEELVTFGALHSNYPNTTVINNAGATMEVKYNEDLKFYANEIMEDAAETIITQDKIQAAVDTWLSAHYSSAEGVSF